MAPCDPAIEYLATTRIDKEGQLNVPEQFREDLGLAPGALFAILRMGDALLLVPQQQLFEHLCQKMSNKLMAAGITEKAALATLPEARKHVFSRRYGRKPSSRS